MARVGIDQAVGSAVISGKDHAQRTGADPLVDHVADPGVVAFM